MSEEQYSYKSTNHSPSIPPGYKQTEVGVIPEDWNATDYIVFGQIIDGDRGIHYPGADDLKDAGQCLFLNHCGSNSPPLAAFLVLIMGG